jgi:hypothetical protein
MKEWELLEEAAAAASASASSALEAAGQGKDGNGNGESGKNTSYQSLLKAVARPLQQLRLVLEGAEAKEKEREWLTGQTSGELDDARLVEGATGEPAIYRRRGEPDKKLGLHQRLPKRMVFCLDCSSSMARGNPWDGRLDRMCQTAAMVMEAIAGFEHKFEYKMVGHSGSGPALPLVEFGQPPTTEAARYEVIKRMVQHAGGCATGDASLDSTAMAVREVVEQQADDYFVFLLSDANLGRYNVKPEELGRELRADERVNAYAIFVAEPGAAAWLSQELPFGHGFVCLDLDKLPSTFKDIFTHAAGT